MPRCSSLKPIIFFITFNKQIQQTTTGVLKRSCFEVNVNIQIEIETNHNRFQCIHTKHQQQQEARKRLYPDGFYKTVGLVSCLIVFNTHPNRYGSLKAVNSWAKTLRITLTNGQRPQNGWSGAGIAQSVVCWARCPA